MFLSWSLGFGHWSLVALVIGIWSLVICTVGCEKGQNVPTTTPARVEGKSPKIASLVPAATDLIIAMGASDHLVAISSWDKDRPDVSGLPVGGDYDGPDWEKISQVRPNVMIVFWAIDRMPGGIKQRADELGIRLVNVKTERVADIFQTIDDLGKLLNEPRKASQLSQKMHAQLDAIAQRVAGKEKIPTLLARDDAGFALIAGDTFADDLLSIAGGKNVAGDFQMRYPTVDAERVLQLSPRVVFQLMPNASPQVVQQSMTMWNKLDSLPAVKDKRVYVLTDWYVLQPGSHIAELAEQFAQKLHPQ